MVSFPVSPQTLLRVASFTALLILLTLGLPAHAVYFQSQAVDGVISIEAENFHRQKNSGQTYSWSSVSDVAYSGGNAIQSLPEDSVRYEYTALSNSARSDYDIDFVTPGTYVVWVRGMGPNGSSDSVHVGMNGSVAASGASLSDFQPWGTARWASVQNGTATKVTVQVNSAGQHTLNLWMRESGTIIDKIVLTTSTSYTPSGMGPAETSQTATSAAAPSFSPAGGSFTGPVNVSLSSATAGASIYYTQDGSTPSAASTLYTGAFTLSGSATVKALAVASGLANSSVAQADYVISGASAFRQALSPDGDIVMEAEHAHSQSELNPAYTWQMKSSANYVGGQAMQALPEDNIRFEYTAVSSSARMDFRVDFQQAGVYYVWVRGLGPNGSSDSIHLGVDGSAASGGANLSDFQPWGSVRWAGVQNATTTPIIVNIPSTGLHTVNVWMRESGTIIDRVLLTRDGSFVPSGNGPAETPQTADSGADSVFLPKVDDRSMIVVEAENYRQTTSASNGQSWQLFDDVSYVTGDPKSTVSAEKAMQVPDNGNRYTSNVPAQSAGLTYKVKFEQSGTYYVWARTKSPSANSNTLHVGLNGSLSSAGTSLTDSSTAGVYEWINQASGGVAQITVSSAGVHTVNVWMDKDGVLLDKLVLTRNSAFVPKLLGPVQSEQGAYRSYPSTPGSTLASWSFDSDPSGGSTRDGVSQRELTCASCPSRVTGILDKAYQFGSGTGLDLPAGAFNLSSAVGFAVETWVKFSSCTTAQGMVGSVSPSSSYQWVIGCENSRVVATMSDSNGNGSGIKLQSSTGQDNGAWHHVVLVRDGVFSETRLYVDGQVADTRSVTQGAFANDAPMTVGRGTLSGAVRTYSGQMDGLGLYSRPLRHDEVLRSYRGKQSGLYRTMWGCELPVRVMPLGDSITAGTNGSRTKYFGTYRTSLYDTLTSTGYNVDFVGSAYSRHTDDQDRDHEGWPGYSSYQLRNIVRDSLAMNTADIVLVHAGTNKLSSALAGMTELLKSVDLYSKNVPVIVARIINQQTYNPAVTQYNSDLAAMVNSRIASGDKLFLVDQEPVLNYATDMYDNLHPSVAGAPKMSTPWYNELVTLLPRCRASNPIIVSPATQNLTAGQSWTFLPDVLGHPSGTFSLSGKPSGMSIHPQTGEIRWPSPVAGTYHVTLNVNNGTGSDSLQFTLAVGAP